MLARFWVKGQTNKIAMNGPPGWGLGKGLMVSHPCKKKIITETRHTFQDRRLVEKCGGLMHNGAQRGKVTQSKGKHGYVKSQI